MDAQQPNQDLGSQATLTRTDAEPKNNETEANETPQVTLQEVLEKFNQRLGVCENLLTELMKAYQMSGQAINRLESFTFTQMKVLLEKELSTFRAFHDMQKDLQSFENLHEFWGVEPIVEEDEVSEQESASSAE